MAHSKAALFDPILPDTLLTVDFGLNLRHVHHIPSLLTQCCLVSFNDGGLHLYRLHPEVEKMEHWAPIAPGTVLDVCIGACDEEQCHLVLVVIVHGDVLDLYCLRVDPRLFWLRIVGSGTMTRPGCHVLRVACNFVRKSVAALYDDGALTLTALPDKVVASLAPRTLATLDREVDAQLVRPPNDHCCCLNYYTPDYVFLLVFSRKENAAVAVVYDVHLHARHSIQSIATSAPWSRAPVTCTFEEGIMTLVVGRKGNSKHVQLVVPTVASNLLDVFSGQLVVPEKPEHSGDIWDLSAAFSSLDQNGTPGLAEATFVSQCARASSSVADLLRDVRQRLEAKRWTEVRPLLASHVGAGQVCITEGCLPGLLPALLARKPSAAALDDVAWYFRVVRQIGTTSLGEGLRYVVRHPKAVGPVADAIIVAATSSDLLAEALAALELNEALFLLRHFFTRLVQLIHSPAAAPAESGPRAGVPTAADVINVAMALLDAHMMDLIAASAEAQQTVAAFYLLCKSYAKYSRDVVQLHALLSAVVGDHATMRRSLVSKDLSAGLLRPPEPQQGGLVYSRIQPRAGGLGPLAVAPVEASAAATHSNGPAPMVVDGPALGAANHQKPPGKRATRPVVRVA